MARLAGRRAPLAPLNSPLPQALFVGALVAIKLLGYGRLIDTLRLWYACGITLLFGAVYLLALRRGVRFPSWVTAVLFLYVAVELLIPAFDFYDETRFINRFEHFIGFAVLTLFVLLVARMFYPYAFSRRSLLLVFALVWGIGLANEIIEYALYHPGRFLNRDTLIDLAMNTAAITMVLLLAPRFIIPVAAGGRV